MGTGERAINVKQNVQVQTEVQYRVQCSISIVRDYYYQKRGLPREKKLPLKGGFPVMAETTRNHIFSKEISQVIIAAMVLAPNFY